MSSLRRAVVVVAVVGVVGTIAFAAGESRAADGANPGPVRVASKVRGHIHPALCRSAKGTLVGIFSQDDFKDLRLTRSEDGGRTWSEPVPFAPTVGIDIYPGALFLAADKRLVHLWNRWYTDPQKPKSRYVEYSFSSDDGLTWSAPQALAKNPEGAHSVLRHAPVELGPREWICSLADRTVVVDPTTGKEQPFGDQRIHGLVPIVRTPAGTLVSGAGLRSTDGGATWEKVSPFPKIGSDGWRYDLTVLDNGWLLAAEVEGPGFGGLSWRFVVSRDDGRSWDFDKTHVFYSPGRAIGGRACPKTVSIDKETIGTLFYDIDAQQPGGPGVFFLRTPIAALTP